jgi:hypothetical protein
LTFRPPIGTSCVTTLPLNQQFYTKKVGIILQVDSIGMAKAGGQGLLDTFNFRK